MLRYLPASEQLPFYLVNAKSRRDKLSRTDARIIFGNPAAKGMGRNVQNGRATQMPPSWKKIAGFHTAAPCGAFIGRKGFLGDSAEPHASKSAGSD
jgi:hypothetical protein